MEGRIGILGLNDVSVSLARAFYEEGLKVDCLYAESNFLSDEYPLSKFSRCFEEFIEFPMKDKEDLKGLKEVLKSKSYDMVLEGERGYAKVLSDNKEELSKYTNIIIPGKEKHSLMYNKEEMFNTALKAGVSVPETVFIDSKEDLSKEFLDNIGEKIVVKNLESSGGVGVEIVDKEKVFEVIESFEGERLMVQEYIDGETKVHVVVCGEGEVLGVLQQEWVRQGINGGPPVYKKIEELDGKILETTKKWVEEANWTGFANFEYKVNEEGIFFIENNGRVTGTLGSNVKAGINLPKIGYEYLMEENISDAGYEPGFCTRHIVRDVEWVLKNFFYGEEVHGTAPWSQYFSEWKNFLKGKETVYQFRWYDPLPALATFYFLFVEFLKGVSPFHERRLV